MTTAPIPQMTQQDQQNFLQAFQAYNAADYPRAIEILRQMEWTLGEHPDVLHLLGSSLAWWGRPEEGRDYLKRAVELNPASAQAWADLGHIYTLAGEYDEAHATIDRGLAARPDHPGALRAKVQLLQRGGRVDEAYSLLQPVMARGASHPNIVLAFAELCRRVGKGDEGVVKLQELIARQGVHPSHKASAYFQLGALLDATGDYDSAWDAYVKGNGLWQGQWDPAQLSQWVDRIIATITRERLASLPRATFHTELPVFIVGFPRSGTTLVEQIIAAHPQAHGAGELNLIPMMTREHPIENLTKETIDRLAKDYVERIQRRSGGSASRITDKNPGNYLHLAYLTLLFPGARIIHCTRDPLDTCLSCFFQDFAHRHPYTRDLRHCGIAYRDYQRVVAHYKSVLDHPILDVNYESLVTDQEAQTRRIIDHLGLPWDDACLRPEEARRITLTASSDQVQRKVYQSSVGRWRHYERHLAPLKEALGIATDGTPTDRLPDR